VTPDECGGLRIPIEIIAAIIGGFATIAASGIAAWATLGKRRAEAEKQQAEARVHALDSAPFRFANHLENVINRLPPPIVHPQDERNVIVNA
jgi:hypothetical protein